jgi:pyruvate/2-oxoglutarate dehydrogenase complex dihydrolipoamide acyltransferase (E2) component
MRGAENTGVFVYDAQLQGRLVGTGAYRGRQWSVVSQVFVMGRDRECDLCLENEPGVSKNHCSIVLEGNEFVLVDAGSRNGTLVNGVLAKRQVLRHGDEVRICNAIFRFERGDAAGTSPGEPAPPPPTVAFWPYFFSGMALVFLAGGGALFLLGVTLQPPEGTAGGPVAQAPVSPPVSKVPDGPGAASATSQATSSLATSPLSAAVAVVAATSSSAAPAPTSAALPRAREPGGPASGPPAPSSSARPPAREPAPDGTREPRRGGGTTPVARAPEAAAPKPSPDLVFSGLLLGASGGGTKVKYAHPGRISAVLVRAGQSVSKGDPLLEYAEGDATPPPLLAPCSGSVEDVGALAGRTVSRGSAAFRILCEGGGPPDLILIATLATSVGSGVTKGDPVVVMAGQDEIPGVVESATRSQSGVKLIIGLERPPPNAREGLSAKFRFMGTGG